MGTGVVGERFTVKAVLGEVVPALNAAGLSGADIVRFGVEVERRMSPGDSFQDFLMCIAAVIVEMDNPQAERAYRLALDVLFGQTH